MGNSQGVIFIRRYKEILKYALVYNKFDPHISSMCKKAAQKLEALNRKSSLLDLGKKKVLFNAVIKSGLPENI